MSDITYIIQFVGQNFMKILPYLLLTIPLAVIVRVTDASEYLKRAFYGHPVKAILIATVVGAFSPFCSCTVVPVIASLLIAGVPLGPVMSFWIASPTMDPEIFFLSVGVLGWELAVVRVVATLFLSAGAGFLTQWLLSRDFFAEGILREQQGSTNVTWRQLATRLWHAVRPASLAPTPALATSGSAQTIALDAIPVTASTSATTESCCAPAHAPTVALDAIPVANTNGAIALNSIPVNSGAIPLNTIPVTAATSESCCSPAPASSIPLNTIPVTAATSESCCSPTPTINLNATGESCAAPTVAQSRRQALLKETVGVVWMVTKFMLLAFAMEALIKLYVPQEAIIALLGDGNPFAVGAAALVGVPIYTSNLTAMPLMGGLLAQGMLPGAVLAFLISGPTTTLPAMAAVFGIAKRRVFMVYLLIALLGAVFFGYVYQLALLLVG